VTIHARGINPGVLAGLGKWGQDVREDGDNIVMSVSEEQALPEINRALVAQGVDVYSIVPQRLSLEDLFIQVVGMDGGL
jgi:ABC-2 type transport system ATP-binding protein